MQLWPQDVVRSLHTPGVLVLTVIVECMVVMYAMCTPLAGNCSYLDHWDSELKKVRYAEEGSAAILYGASMYRPGRKPAAIYIRKDPGEAR